MKLGRKARKFNPRIPHYSALLAGTTPTYPPEQDNTTNLPAALGMLLNDQLGDCTCAGVYHADQVWSQASCGTTPTFPDSDVEALYHSACGYDPSNPSTDQGGIEQDVLTYVMNTGFITPAGTKKIAAFLEVDPRNLDDVRATIWECGVSYIGFNVPAFLMANGPPAVWDVNPSGDNSIVGGHCVVLAGYSSTDQTFKLISWGQVFAMTQAFFSQFTDETYAIASPDWIAATGNSPAGMTLQQLEQQMAALKT